MPDWRIDVTFTVTAKGDRVMDAWGAVKHLFPSGHPDIQMTDLRISVVPPDPDPDHSSAGTGHDHMTNAEIQARRRDA